MGRLVVIEGLDGAGKRTLADRLTAELNGGGASVAKLAFPRYGENVHADLVREALHRGHGDLADSVYGMALLYALDRSEAADEIRALLAANDVVLLDRYVASNAAYAAARLRQDKVAVRAISAGKNHPFEGQRLGGGRAYIRSHLSCTRPATRAQLYHSIA